MGYTAGKTRRTVSRPPGLSRLKTQRSADVGEGHRDPRPLLPTEERVWMADQRRLKGQVVNTGAGLGHGGQPVPPTTRQVDLQSTRSQPPAPC